MTLIVLFWVSIMNQLSEAEELEIIVATQDLINDEIKLDDYLSDKNTELNCTKVVCYNDEDGTQKHGCSQVQTHKQCTSTEGVRFLATASEKGRRGCKYK